MYSYINGGYHVSIAKNGTKVRTQLSEQPPVHPEHMDLKITDWCDGGCAWCHESSTTGGKHGDVQHILTLLKSLPPGVEVAIGGGDPLSHPDFEYLVTGMSDHGLIPNVTVNGKHFERHLGLLDKLTSRNRLFGVGVSYQGTIPNWDWPHMVVHLITGIHKPEVLDEIARKKILLLGYKNHGRGANLLQSIPASILANIQQWYRELFWVAKEHSLSFDNLAIEQLKPQRLFISEHDFNTRYMGTEGSFGMYLDGVTETFALSSYSAERFAWSAMPSMFQKVRTELAP